MSGWKKLAAAAAGGDVTNVENVFSTYLWEGTSSALDITNNIDFTGEGGMLWIKPRSVTSSHWIQDTERGAGKMLRTNVTDAELDLSSSQPDFHFNSDGFGVAAGTELNYNGEDMTSWSFRKAPKFFDIITATSTGSSSRVLSHNLGCDVGFAVVKDRDQASNWISRHRSMSSGQNFNLNSSQAAFTFSGVVSFNSTTITINESNFLGTGRDYVVYLFAHNNGDGGFGPNSDQDIIKCGSYTGDGTSNATNIVDVGFEPQWLLIKKISGAGDWFIIDNMRGFIANITQSSDAGDTPLGPNQTWAESANLYAWAAPTPNGFALENSFGSFNENGGSYVYVAIRRGPMALPENGDAVFETAYRDATVPAFDSGWPVDMAVYYNNISTLHSKYLGSRPQGKWILIPKASGAVQDLNAFEWDYMDGYYSTTGTSTTVISHMWRRYPQCFDVVCYTGNGTAGLTVDHNLEVAPEMMWVKRTDASADWQVYHSSQGATKYSPSFRTDVFYTSSGRWNNTAPTSSVFTLGNDSDVNASSGRYVAYLFATLSGVTKVGSYSGTGSNINVDCGFSNGAKFIMIKRADTEIQSTTHWYVWDSLRGIVAGNDPYLEWDTVAAEVTNTDYIDPLSSGFTVTSSANSGINASGGTYIFYAVAA